MDQIFFSDWENIRRTFIIGFFTYVGTVVVFRLTGKRTLSKFNSFDFIITVAFGSTVATALLNKNVTLLQALSAICVLVFLQFVLTWSSVRWPFLANWIKSDPTLLYYDGQFREKAMKRERFLREEVMAAVRGSGYGHLGEVQAVILETDGSLTVIARDQMGDMGAMENVTNLEDEVIQRAGKEKEAGRDNATGSTGV